MMKVEIAHDLLAKSVYTMAKTEQKVLKRAKSMIQSGFSFYQADQRILLGQAELNAIYPVLKELSLSKEQQAFVQLSHQQLLKRKRQLSIRNYLIIALALFSVFTPPTLWNLYRVQSAKHQVADAEEKIQLTQIELKNVRNNYVQLRKGVEDGTLDPEVLSIEAWNQEEYGNLRSSRVVYATLEFSGAVYDDEQKALEGVVIQLLGARVKTNQQGRFHCFVVLPPLMLSQSHLEIELEKEGFEPLRQLISPNKNLEKDFTLIRRKTSVY